LTSFNTPLAYCAAAASRVKHGLPYAAERIRPGAMDGDVPMRHGWQSIGGGSQQNQQEIAPLMILRNRPSSSP
jgi:hypothetical protein